MSTSDQPKPLTGPIDPLNHRVTHDVPCGNTRCSRTFDRDEDVAPHQKFCSSTCRIEHNNQRRKRALHELAIKEKGDESS